MTMWSMKVTTTAMATSALIIAIVTIIIATTGRVKLSAVALELASEMICCPLPLY